MRTHPIRAGVLLFPLVTALAVSCTLSDGGAVTVPPTGPATTAGDDGVATTAPVVADGPYAPDPAPPVGPFPSLNESAGCGPLQGIRGPYASVAGDLDDGEAVLGPWGDLYGRDFGEIRSHLVEVALPMTGDREVTVWVHEAVLPALEAAVANLEREEAAGNYYRIRAGEVSSFRPATVTPKRYLSFHAVGAAIDINTTTNPYSEANQLVTDLPEWFVAAWTDAGWCWGGDWQTIKDSMHFSWQGPLYTAGYRAAPPAAPRTAPDGFRRSLDFDTVLGPAPDGSRLLVADMDRDGAPDLVRLHPWTAAGNQGVEIAQAIYGFEAGCTPLVTSPVGTGATLLLADGDGDARPDLWEVGEAGGEVTVTIHTFASGFAERLRPRKTGVPAGGEATFLAADFDRDGSTDLFVVSAGSVEVWAGPGFTRRLASAPLPGDIEAGWRFALGDRDVDGVPDLFALSPSDPARLVVLPGAGGFAAVPEEIATGVSGRREQFQVGDLDGDGRPDLYFPADDGSLAVYLGGDRGDASDADLTYWFAEGDDQPRTRQEGCPVVPDEG